MDKQAYDSNDKTQLYSYKAMTQLSIPTKLILRLAKTTVEHKQNKVRAGGRALESFDITLKQGISHYLLETWV